MRKLKKEKLQVDRWYMLGIIIFAICFTIPSIQYFAQHRTILEFQEEFCFLLTNANRLYQTAFYGIIITGLIFFYYEIIKNRNTIFKNEKQIFIGIFIVSAIFVFVIPFMSSDVFYYLGIGRLDAKYGQNPYYVTMTQYVENENPNLGQDTVLQKGYHNYWANTTVVYGPVWTIICKILSIFSLGNVDIGLFVFKLANLIVHLVNCYFIFKITKKKIFVVAYGFNPFVLVEGIANVHNDMFVVLFILLALYELLKRKKLLFAVFFLAMATDIKYFAIILLPLFVIYFYRNEKIAKRIIKCIEYGAIYLVFVGIPYFIYIRDFQVFMGMSAQRERIAKGLYCFISEYFVNPPNLCNILAEGAFYSFVVVYFYVCVSLLLKSKIKFGNEIKIVYQFMIAFLFLLITNFQPWYFMWLSPFMFWQRSQNIKLIIQMQLLTLVANMVFLTYSENYVYGVPFFMIFIVGILACMLSNKKDRQIYIQKDTKLERKN